MEHKEGRLLAMRADDQLFRIGDELAQLLIASLTGARVSGNLAYRRPMLFFFLKSFKTYRAIALLCCEGFVEDATILARSIYEVRLQAIYLSGDLEKRGMLFTRYWYKVGCGTLQILKSKGEKEWQNR